MLVNVHTTFSCDKGGQGRRQDVAAKLWELFVLVVVILVRVAWDLGFPCSWCLRQYSLIQVVSCAQSTDALVSWRFLPNQLHSRILSNYGTTMPERQWDGYYGLSAKITDLLYKLSGQILWLLTLSGNNDMAVGMVWQDCLDDNVWCDVVLTIVAVNGRHLWILLYSNLICIVLWLFSLLFFRGFQSEEEEFGTFAAKIHQIPMWNPPVLWYSPGTWWCGLKVCIC